MRREFYEVQRFTQWWLWLILIALALVPFYGIYQQVFLGNSIEDKAISDNGLIVYTIFMILLLVFFGVLRLKTSMNKHKLSFSFYPFVNKSVKWGDVKNAKLVDYGFVGYGIRFSKFGKVYNTGGKLGLLIELKNGKSFVIGTQKEGQLKDFLEGISLA